MPLTPFHLGPGLFFSSIFKRLNLWAFLLGNIILDIEPFCIILYNRNFSYYSYPHHGILHSLFGGFFGALLIALVLKNFNEISDKFLKGRIRFKKDFSFLNLFLSSYLGCGLHLVFDSFMHYDVFPFWPLRLNPFLNLISISQNYFLCTILGILGIIILKSRKKMTREKALKIIDRYIKNENMKKHMLATEAIMRALAENFGRDQEKWGMAGLLHDIDAEIVDCKSNPERHGMVGAEILENLGVEKEICDAIRAHNEATGKERNTLMEKALYCTDPLTGLIVAAVLVLPSKKLGDLKTQNVLNRFKEKAFARGANREIIASCSEIGLSLEEFVEIGLKAMQEISDQLGL